MIIGNDLFDLGKNIRKKNEKNKRFENKPHKHK